MLILIVIHPVSVMPCVSLPHLFPHGHYWIKGPHRVLEYHTNMVIFRHFVVFSVYSIRQHTHNAFKRESLARSGFTYYTKAFSGVKIKAQVFYYIPVILVCKYI